MFRRSHRQRAPLKVIPENHLQAIEGCQSIWPRYWQRYSQHQHEGAAIRVTAVDNMKGVQSERIAAGHHAPYIRTWVLHATPTVRECPTDSLTTQAVYHVHRWCHQCTLKVVTQIDDSLERIGLHTQLDEWSGSASRKAPAGLSLKEHPFDPIFDSKRNRQCESEDSKK